MASGSDELSEIELEIKAEQAAALGVAGRRLEETVGRYRRAEQIGFEGFDQEGLLFAVADDLWALQIQREAYGAHGHGTELLAREYGVPAAAVARVGASPPVG